MSLLRKATKIGFGLSSSRGRRALREGVATATEHLRILRARQWKTIVDVGANKGQFALAAHRVHPLAVIHSFEPLEGPASKFRGVLGDVPNVHLHRCAVGESSAKASMNVSARDDSSSLLPISKKQNQLFPGTEAVGLEEVEVKTLEGVLSASLIKPPALLKLDVQGYEHQALRGCEGVLSCFQGIYVECSLVELYAGQTLITEIIAWLHAKGFRLTDIGDLTRGPDGSVVQGDFLFEKS